ncbi:MAG: calycin-like domain-containing protein [Bacteroidales bacterium]|jgi:hypothetical protein|nr:calycin-like domain-containing protein [Bacteroidales bacterium]
MKKVIVMAIAALAIFSGCNKDNDTKTPVVSNAVYSGQLKVTFQGSVYTTENVVIETTPNTTANKNAMDIKMDKVKFVPQMPVSVDITIPAIEYTTSDDGTITFSGDNIIPTAMGGAYPAYTVTDLTGTIKDGKINMSLKFGSFPTSYSGEEQKAD